jgi:hypothetical protein
MRKATTPRKPATRRRYQAGTLKDEGDRWMLRWREDEFDPSGKVKRVRKWEVLSKRSFPTQTLAQRELDKNVSRANGKTLSLLPHDLRAVEVLLCDSCRARFITALQAGE